MESEFGTMSMERESVAMMASLRAAFSSEHALQCGYCTPGMLITARDIVLRLPHADEARIRKVLPKFRAVTLAGDGHFLMMEDPQRFNPALEAEISAMVAPRE